MPEPIVTDDCTITFSEYGARCTDCGQTQPGPLVQLWASAHAQEHENLRRWTNWSQEVSNVVTRVVSEASVASKQGTLYADGRRDALLWVADVLADVQVHAMGEPEY